MAAAMRPFAVGTAATCLCYSYSNAHTHQHIICSSDYSQWRNFTLKSGGDQWRRQDLVSGRHDDRGAEGASIDVPKATSGVGYGVSYGHRGVRSPDD